ncbi:alpha/beta hydrolase [Amycolatopsis mediterranei S699]|uniref:Alpha/beta hydrolase n=2 Tax=Amycolatopsis mediterranei TaxID=33910 RepID=A0A0H3DA85_AMYMU|nr:alpha/beta hydrolase [Amycolatopsis mediterranei]ADJ46454.1 alpha/beta hydrolase [Amycolatopsis mediterranei U32]AEK43252.1 alpha/beta hydrolase [Amycolatopsis mediterranei S699]AFO78165.1 alpha/beta hydrolase [Amycolatopsis mediterranei S699]AGT85293.1 alpha/beta hydrolase [Amycolatopsis mediterranei RB]KDO06308.1 alpha/beta hydrolase [Amycolatopsis mediterranei]
MKIAASDHETTVTARGTRGPAVVLVHSLGLDRRMWDPVLDRLAEGRRVFTPDALAAGGVRYARECLASVDPPTWASIWRGYGGLDVYDRLRGFPAPALALAGEADASIPVEGMAAIAGRIGPGGAKFEVVAGAPHIQTLERPDAVANALARFLPAEIDIP